MTEPRPTVRLRVGGTRGHLFFFKKMVHRPEPPIDPGVVVDVYDRDNSFVGRAFYNPRSNISLRLLSTKKDEEVGDEFFRARLKTAAELRQNLLKLPEVTDAYRLCHAEGDGLSGLIIDKLGPVLSIELFSRGFFKILDRLKAILLEIFPGSVFSVRADTEIEDIEGFRLPVPEAIEGIVIREHGIQYKVDFAKGHKTGFFCDQRDNRVDVAKLARDRNCLDLCTYTGGFALSMVKGGAKQVTAVDLDEKALETARTNAQLNKAKVEFLHADLFNYLRQSKTKYDLIVLDPAKLARDPEDLLKAKRTYHDMNGMALKAANPGAILVTCSCSGMVSEEEFLQIVRSASQTVDRPIQIFKVTGAGPDHPVSSLYPEGRYLKAVFARVW